MFVLLLLAFAFCVNVSSAYETQSQSPEGPPIFLTTCAACGTGGGQQNNFDLNITCSSGYICSADFFTFGNPYHGFWFGGPPRSEASNSNCRFDRPTGSFDINMTLNPNCGNLTDTTYFNQLLNDPTLLGGQFYQKPFINFGSFQSDPTFYRLWRTSQHPGKGFQAFLNECATDPGGVNNGNIPNIYVSYRCCQCQSQSASMSQSNSFSQSGSRSRSQSDSDSRSFSRSFSRSDSRSDSQSDSRSVSMSQSHSDSRSFSRSFSNSQSQSRSFSRSQTRSDSQSQSNSRSQSHSQSRSRSDSRSHSNSRSRSGSLSQSRSMTPSKSPILAPNSNCRTCSQIGGRRSNNPLLTITCPNGFIQNITFASYGLPTGNCSDLRRGFAINPNCHNTSSVVEVEKFCLGKRTCVVPLIHFVPTTAFNTGCRLPPSTSTSSNDYTLAVNTFCGKCLNPDTNSFSQSQSLSRSDSRSLSDSRSHSRSFSRSRTESNSNSRSLSQSDSRSSSMSFSNSQTSTGTLSASDSRSRTQSDSQSFSLSQSHSQSSSSSQSRSQINDCHLCAFALGTFGVSGNTGISLSCPRGTICDISFGNAGYPAGVCGPGISNSFVVDPVCNSSSSGALIQSRCLGQPSCDVQMNDFVITPQEQSACIAAYGNNFKAAIAAYCCYCDESYSQSMSRSITTSILPCEPFGTISFSSGNSELTLNCPVGWINTTTFASFGDPFGTNPRDFEINPNCHNESTVALVNDWCKGKRNCVIPWSIFDSSPAFLARCGRGFSINDLSLSVAVSCYNCPNPSNSFSQSSSQSRSISQSYSNSMSRSQSQSDSQSNSQSQSRSESQSNSHSQSRSQSFSSSASDSSSQSRSRSPENPCAICGFFGGPWGQENKLEIVCPYNGYICDISYAKFGLNEPGTSCNTGYSNSRCTNETDTLDIIRSRCYGDNSCVINIQEFLLPSSCPAPFNRYREPGSKIQVALSVFGTCCDCRSDSQSQSRSLSSSKSDSMSQSQSLSQSASASESESQSTSSSQSASESNSPLLPCEMCGYVSGTFSTNNQLILGCGLQNPFAYICNVTFARFGVVLDNDNDNSCNSGFTNTSCTNSSLSVIERVRNDCIGKANCILPLNDFALPSTCSAASTYKDPRSKVNIALGISGLCCLCSFRQTDSSSQSQSQSISSSLSESSSESQSLTLSDSMSQTQSISQSPDPPCQLCGLVSGTWFTNNQLRLGCNSANPNVYICNITYAKFGLVETNTRCNFGFFDRNCTNSSAIIMQTVEDRCLGKPFCDFQLNEFELPMTCPDYPTYKRKLSTTQLALGISGECCACEIPSQSQSNSRSNSISLSQSISESQSMSPSLSESQSMSQSDEIPCNICGFISGTWLTNNRLTLGCGSANVAATICNVTFANFGLNSPDSTCESGFTNQTCNNATTFVTNLVNERCLGKKECTLRLNEFTLPPSCPQAAFYQRKDSQVSLALGVSGVCCNCIVPNPTQSASATPVPTQSFSQSKPTPSPSPSPSFPCEYCSSVSGTYVSGNAVELGCGLQNPNAYICNVSHAGFGLQGTGNCYGGFLNSSCSYSFLPLAISRCVGQKGCSFFLNEFDLPSSCPQSATYKRRDSTIQIAIGVSGLCCSCNVQQTLSPSPTPSQTETQSPSQSASPSATPSQTESESYTAPQTNSLSNSPIAPCEFCGHVTGTWITGNRVTLGCGLQNPNAYICNVSFAQYGHTTSDSDCYGGFDNSTCNFSILSEAEQRCVGKTSCSFFLNEFSLPNTCPLFSTYRNRNSVDQLSLGLSGLCCDCSQDRSPTRSSRPRTPSQSLSDSQSKSQSRSQSRSKSKSKSQSPATQSRSDSNTPEPTASQSQSISASESMSQSSEFCRICQEQKASVDSQLVLPPCPNNGYYCNITFASFGLFDGSCNSQLAINPTCHNSSTQAIVEAACLNKRTCGFDLGEFVTPSTCPKRINGNLAVYGLAIEAQCCRCQPTFVFSSSPIAGGAGTILTVTGSGFTSTSVVKVGTEVCTVVSLTGTKLTCIVPPLPSGQSAPLVVDVTVDDVESPNPFLYVAAPIITAISPSVATLPPGSNFLPVNRVVINITGMHLSSFQGIPVSFFIGGSRLNSTPAFALTNTDTFAQVYAPSNRPAGTYNVTAEFFSTPSLPNTVVFTIAIQTPPQSRSSSRSLSRRGNNLRSRSSSPSSRQSASMSKSRSEGAIPSIRRIAPTRGSGGTVLTVFGSNLFIPSLGVNGTYASILIDGIPMTKLPGGNSTVVTVVVPTNVLPLGRYPVTGSIGNRPSRDSQPPIFELVSGFTGFHPVAGPANVTLTVNGDNFATTPTIMVGGRPCVVINFNATQAVCLVPSPGSNTTFPLPANVTVNGENATLPFLYIERPTITSVVPSAGDAGVIITLFGTGFVAHNGILPTFFLGSSPAVLQSGSLTLTSARVRVDALLPIGKYPATVNVFSLVSQDSPTPTYSVVPKSITPSAGLGNTPITINGGIFNPNITHNVTVGGAPCTITSVTSSVIICVVPDKNVTEPTNATVVVDGAVAPTPFTYFPRPIITAVTPASGPVDTPVTITGKNFFPINGVNPTFTIGGLPAAIAPGTTPTNTSAVVIVPSALPRGPHRVAASVFNGGASSVDPIDFTVLPRLDRFTPKFGRTGDLLNITGSNLGNNGGDPLDITVGGEPCIVVFSNSTFVSCRLPASPSTLPFDADVVVDGVAFPEKFLYPAAPSIGSISPTSGPAGTLATIQGSNLVSNDTRVPDPIFFIGGERCNLLQSPAPTATSVVCMVPSTLSLNQPHNVTASIPGSSISSNDPIPPTFTVLSSSYPPASSYIDNITIAVVDQPVGQPFIDFVENPNRQVNATIRFRPNGVIQSWTELVAEFKSSAIPLSVMWNIYGSLGQTALNLSNVLPNDDYSVDTATDIVLRQALQIPLTRSSLQQLGFKEGDTLFINFTLSGGCSNSTTCPSIRATFSRVLLFFSGTNKVVAYKKISDTSTCVFNLVAFAFNPTLVLATSTSSQFVWFCESCSAAGMVIPSSFATTTYTFPSGTLRRRQAGFQQNSDDVDTVSQITETNLKAFFASSPALTNYFNALHNINDPIIISATFYLQGAIPATTRFRILKPSGNIAASSCAFFLEQSDSTLLKAVRGRESTCGIYNQQPAYASSMRFTVSSFATGSFSHTQTNTKGSFTLTQPSRTFSAGELVSVDIAGIQAQDNDLVDVRVTVTAPLVGNPSFIAYAINRVFVNSRPVITNYRFISPFVLSPSSALGSQPSPLIELSSLVTMAVDNVVDPNGDEFTLSFVNSFRSELEHQTGIATPTFTLANAFVTSNRLLPLTTSTGAPFEQTIAQAMDACNSYTATEPVRYLITLSSEDEDFTSNVQSLSSNAMTALADGDTQTAYVLLQQAISYVQLTGDAFITDDIVAEVISVISNIGIQIDSLLRIQQAIHTCDQMSELVSRAGFDVQTAGFDLCKVSSNVKNRTSGITKRRNGADSLFALLAADVELLTLPMSLDLIQAWSSLFYGDMRVPPDDFGNTELIEILATSTFKSTCGNPSTNVTSNDGFISFVFTNTKTAASMKTITASANGGDNDSTNLVFASPQQYNPDIPEGDCVLYVIAQAVPHENDVISIQNQYFNATLFGSSIFQVKAYDSSNPAIQFDGSRGNVTIYYNYTYTRVGPFNYIVCGRRDGPESPFNFTTCVKTQDEQGFIACDCVDLNGQFAIFTVRYIDFKISHLLITILTAVVGGGMLILFCVVLYIFKVYSDPTRGIPTGTKPGWLTDEENEFYGQVYGVSKKQNVLLEEEYDARVMGANASSSSSSALKHEMSDRVHHVVRNPLPPPSNVDDVSFASNRQYQLKYGNGTTNPSYTTQSSSSSSSSSFNNNNNNNNNNKDFVGEGRVNPKSTNINYDAFGDE